jgi:hypothetical protein
MCGGEWSPLKILRDHINEPWCDVGCKHWEENNQSGALCIVVVDSKAILAYCGGSPVFQGFITTASLYSTGKGWRLV